MWLRDEAMLFVESWHRVSSLDLEACDLLELRQAMSCFCDAIRQAVA